MSAKLRPSPRNRPVAVLGIALAIAAALLVVACGGENGDATARPPASAAVRVVSIRDFLYKPATVTVAVGSRLEFINADDAPHTATSGTSPSADGVFDTGTLTKGQRRSVRLSKAGTFAYYCEIHPFMKATVIVR
jgi:plastocyanin